MFDPLIARRKKRHELYNACVQGDSKAIEKILGEGLEPEINYTYYLLVAGDHKHLAIVKLMVEMGVVIRKNNFDELRDLIGMGNVEIVAYLLDQYEKSGVEKNALAYELDEALVTSFCVKKIDLSEFLISRGANVRNAHEQLIGHALNDRYLEGLRAIDFWFALRAEEVVFSVEKIRKCILDHDDLFHFLPMDSPAHREKVISIYLSGVDLSKQVDFPKHQAWLENYVCTVKTELVCVGLIADLVRLVMLLL